MHDEEEVQILFQKYNEVKMDTDVKKIDYKICPVCSSKMTIYPTQSEIRCGQCDFTFLLKGIVFDETNMYTSDGTLTKRGSYETSRHCRYHLERILAIKSINNIETLTEKIVKWLRQNNYKYFKLVTCRDLRRCLKDIKETRYNEHIPFLRQLICGVSPERLFHHEMRIVYIYFDKAAVTFDKIRFGVRANLKYYPYFIFKIIEMILNTPEDQKRLSSIVDCIHFQRDNTIVSNDRLWKEICEKVQTEIPEFVFKKTDKNLLQ